MAEIIARSPALPYVHQFPNGLRAGQVFVFNAVVNYDADRIEINFMCGIGKEVDVALHFNPRFDSQVVVVNDYRNRKWGTEKRVPMCFRKGDQCQIVIEVEFSSFNILVNGGLCAEFKNHIPLQRVSILEVVKGLHVREITLQDKYNKSAAYEMQITGGSLPPRPSYPTGTHPPPQPGYPPSQPTYPPRPGYQPPPYHQPGGFYPPAPGSMDPPAPGGCFPPAPGSMGPPAPGSSFPPAPGSMGNQIVNPSVPFTSAIPGGVMQGKMIYISGRPKQLPYRFQINLKCMRTPRQDKALHFDVRFSHDNCVVRNSQINGEWGQEERHSHGFPFQPGASFDLIIRVENDRYMVAVNGQHFIEYRHRIPALAMVDNLNIEGDVNIYSIKFA